MSGIFFLKNVAGLDQRDRFLGVCRRIPSSARERVIFSSGKDGEAGDVGSIVDARVQPDGKRAARSQIEFSDRLPATGSLYVTWFKEELVLIAQGDELLILFRAEAALNMAIGIHPGINPVQIIRAQLDLPMFFMLGQMPEQLALQCRTNAGFRGVAFKHQLVQVLVRIVDQVVPGLISRQHKGCVRVTRLVTFHTVLIQHRLDQAVETQRP